MKRGFSGIDEIQWLEGVYHGVPLSSEPWEYRLGRPQRPFDYSQGFRFGCGYPPFGDTLMAISIPENVVSPYEVTLDGRLESLPRQFIAPGSGLNDCDGSLLTIVTNGSDLSGDS
ncbi:MAG TPA: hypothetical protein EYN14_06670 [Alphaproteobacteria bacterium]|nr:hypothetical protein [Alphaproteobacteria bacterium]